MMVDNAQWCLCLSLMMLKRLFMEHNGVLYQRSSGYMCVMAVLLAAARLPHPLRALGQMR